MAKYIYPAVFDPGIDVSEGYTITFPDLPGCISEGEDIQNALYMAKDVLEGLMYALEEDGSIIPVPSNPSAIQAPEGGFVVLVEAWTDIVRDEAENKAIKKTLTIPKWLNDAAEKNKINFSQLLQFAIKKRLGIKHP